MKKISLSLSDGQFKELKRLADEENTTITDFVIARLPIARENKLVISDVLKKAHSTQSKIFTLPDLFDKEEWEAYTNGSRISAGRAFYKRSKEKGSPFMFIGKNSANLAVYEKTGD